MGWSFSSQASSTGHMVVRPGEAGRMRRPVSAKKMALISSDLPRENSATKATTSLSDSRRWRSDSAMSAEGADSRSLLVKNLARLASSRASDWRQLARASRAGTSD